MVKYLQLLVVLSLVCYDVSGFTLFRGGAGARTASLTNNWNWPPLSPPPPRATSPLQAAVSVSIEVATCLLPTCGGYLSTEFGVSYAYGMATALTSWFIWQGKILPVVASTTSAASLWKNWATWHATALMFYGIRLCAFLFIRQQTSKRIQEMRQRIDAKSRESGASRLSRTPFVLSCSLLYFGLCAPLYLTSSVLTLSPGNDLASCLIKGLVISTWTGFLVAALGDFTKSIVKARKGEDHLVTSGIFGWLRHPNYTGEMLGWSSNGLAGLVAFFSLGQFQKVQPWFYVASSLVGVMGINLVLLLATRNLEKKQADIYGSQEEYKKWTETSWAGFAMPDKKADPVTPQLEVSSEEQDGGSGI